MSDDPLALPDYVPGGAAVLGDAERWPTLTADGAARLAAVRTHPAAPRWTHATGDRLTAEQIERARRPLPTEGWLDEHLACARQLPAYRRRSGLDSLGDFPTITRADLAADVSAFVPMDADFSRIVHGTSSGSTGAALQIPDDIEEVARSFHLLVDLVRAEGVDWRPDHGRLALVNLVLQHQAYTYCSVLSGFDQTVMARINLAPADWPRAEAAAEFLAAHDPQVITGDPSTFEALLRPELATAVRPLALFSGAMDLAAPLRAALGRTFSCPVFDVYGLHETRPIAVRTDDGPFRILPRRVHVEILDGAGDAVPEGDVGEIVVTAGENPFLPLVRYRTGDFARLVHVEGKPALADLEGRAHIRFRSRAGALVPSVDLTQQLQALGCVGWTVHQEPTGRLSVRIVGGRARRVREVLQVLVGFDVTVEAVDTLADLGPGKPRRYTVAHSSTGKVPHRT